MCGWSASKQRESEYSIEVCCVELTAVFKKVEDRYVGWIEELPGAITEGDTLAEAHENIIEAAQMVLEANHELSGSPMPAEISLKEKVSLVAV
jgi:predicted RNase H-like HicB family nuclease